MAGRYPSILLDYGILAGSPIGDEILSPNDLSTYNPYSVQGVRPLATTSPVGPDIAQSFSFHEQQLPFFGNDFMAGGGRSTEAVPQAPRMQWSPSLAPADIVNALAPSIGAADGAFAPSMTLRNNQSSSTDNAFFRNDEWPTQSATPPAVTPVGYRLPRPWPGMPGPWAIPTAPLGGWTEHAIKGHQEGLRRLRSFRKTAREKAEKECWRRHDEEARECKSRYRDRVHDDHYDGCMKRALQRREACLHNGYPNGPGELRKWGDEDEDVWFNTDR